MNRINRIRSIVEQALSPQDIDIVDESALHAGHAGAREGGETHYRMRIVAQCFAGKSRVQRERMVHQLLDGEYAQGLHALSIKALAPDEANGGTN